MPFDKLRTIRRLFTVGAALMTLGAAWLAVIAGRYAVGVRIGDEIARAHSLVYVGLTLGVLLFGLAVWVFGALALRQGEMAGRELVAQRASLAESEQRYRMLFENAPSGIMRVTAAGRILAANPAVVRMLGYASEAELLSVPAPALFAQPPEAARLARVADETGHTGSTFVRWRHRNGHSLEIRLQRNVIRNASGLATDFEDVVEEVTDLLRLEEQFRQAQKMEAVGRLAGGVAHDFNNLLTVILGNISLLRESLPASHDALDFASRIEEAASSAGTLTQQLLTFARKTPIRRGPVDVNRAVARVASLLQRVIGAQIQLVQDLVPAEASIICDAVQLEQAIMNLAVNARDAMPTGGVLTLRTRLLGDPRRVQLEVTDTGCGMDADTRQHLFEPFFTTKAPGKGTGLGLAMVYGVVKQMDAAVDVHSEPGRGTTFTITMPQTAVSPLVTPCVAPARPGSGTEVILVVDDEPSICQVVSLILTRRGYNVTTAGSAEEGLALLAQRSDIDLVLTDVILRGKSGIELACIIRSESPQVPVILMSGYSQDDVRRRESVPAGTLFLEKPISPIALLEVIREGLDTRQVGQRRMPPIVPRPLGSAVA